MSQKPTHKELKKKVQELEHFESGHNQRQSRVHTNSYLEMLNNSLQDAIFTVKMPERTVEYSNKAVEQIFGYSAECIYGKTTEMLYPDTSSYHEFARKLQRAKDGKDERLQTEHLLKKKSGELFTAEISSTFIRSKEDVSHVVSIVRDISDRKLLEESLQKVLALYEAVVEDQAECISRFKPDGTFIFANKAYCNFVGISEAEITDNTWSVVVHEDDEGHINDLLQTMTPENPTVVIENRVFNAVGEERWMQFVNRGFFNKNGNLTETQSVGRDITVLKEKEGLLLAKEKDLKEKSAQLIKVNTALEVLLERRNQQLDEMKEKVIRIFNTLITPELLLIKTKLNSAKDQKIVSFIINNVNNLFSQYDSPIASSRYNLTKTELQIASLVREGMKTPEIADHLCISTNTVGFHRKNIRRKLGLHHSDTSLFEFLQSSR